MIPFGEWAPDRADLGTDTATEAKNVIPYPGSYGPLAGPSAYSAALSAEPKGAFCARQTSGSFVIFAATATGLWKLDGTTWTDVSRLVGGAYTGPGDDFWSFAQYQNKLVTTNLNDAVQVIDVDSGTNFDALAGSPPQARFVDTFNQFLVLSSLSGNPNRTQWSGLFDIEEWTSGTNSSDFQDHPDGGWVMGWASAAGLVVMQGRIRRVAYTGDDLVMRFDDMEEELGCVAPYSIVRVGANVMFLSEEGFMVANAGGSGPIGFQKVDTYFAEDINQDRLSRVIGVSDPKSKRILWAYHSVNNSNAYYDRLLIYDRISQRWARAETNLYYMFSAATPGTTLEGLDGQFSSIDDMDISLDSAVWQGGSPLVAVFDEDYKLSFLSGANMEAILETAEVQLNPRGRAFVNGFTPVVDSAEAVGQVATRSRRGDAFSWRSEASQNSSGVIPARADGRFHRFRMRIPEGGTWTHAQGVDPMFTATGER